MDQDAGPNYGKLGIHVNATIDNIDRIVEEWRPRVVVLLDHSDVWHRVKAEVGDETVFIGRVVLSQEPDFTMHGSDPRAAAEAICDEILPMAERMRGVVDYWAGCNEPALPDYQSCRRLAASETYRMQIMADHGHRCAVLGLSTGVPHISYWQAFEQMLNVAVLYEACIHVHEYAWPLHLDPALAPWYELRHEFVWRGVDPSYNPEPADEYPGLPQWLKAVPWYITEGGLDEGNQTLGKRQGHLDHMTPEQYLMSLWAWDQRLQATPYVKGAAIFCLGNGHWRTYNISGPVLEGLVRDAEPLPWEKEVIYEGGTPCP